MNAPCEAITHTLPSLDEITAALSYLDSTDRDTWVRMGMACKDAEGEAAFPAWDGWSQTASNYDAKAAQSVWKSIKPGRVTVATLFYEARQAGWKPSTPYTPPTPAQRAVLEAERKAADEAGQAIMAEQREAKAALSRKIWKAAHPVLASHEYLGRKGIQPHCARLATAEADLRDDTGKPLTALHGKVLLIPMYRDGAIVGLQAIQGDGERRFIGSPAGAACLIGGKGAFDNPAVVLIGEGFATAASLNEATDHPALCAFSKGNLLAVAITARKRWPGAKLVLCADLDADGGGEAKAREAAEACGGIVALPDFTWMDEPGAHSDFNDLHQLAGKDAVAHEIHIALSAETRAQPQKTENLTLRVDQRKKTDLSDTTDKAPPQARQSDADQTPSEPLPLRAKRRKKTDTTDSRTVIQVTAGNMHRIVEQAELALAADGNHYQRGGLIVVITVDHGTGEVVVQPVGQAGLAVALSRVSTFQRFDKRCESWVTVDPPQRHVAALHDANSYKALPVLSGLVRQPYLRPDGSLVTAPGYDPATKVFSLFDSGRFSIPANPTPEDALTGLALLSGLLAEFHFKDAFARSAALCALLTAAIRPSLPTAPQVHVSAHTIGSGKSYLCALFTALATPMRSAPATFPAEDEECRKLLLSTLMTAPAVVEFDNLTTDLMPLKSLCVALTSEFFTGRVLGVSKTATVSTRALFLSSGNNTQPVGDMTRRTLVIELDPRVENPAQRDFQRPNLLAEVQRERGRYVSAALTVIRAWIAAGRPEATCKPVASFGEWTHLCRQPLLWLGEQDPAQGMFRSMAADPDRELLGRLLTAWHEAFDKKACLIRDAISLGYDRHPDLIEAVKEVAETRGEIDRRRLGWWIKRHAGRIVEGLRFMPGDATRNAGSWRVELVLSDESVVSDKSVFPSRDKESVSEEPKPSTDAGCSVAEKAESEELDEWTAEYVAHEKASFPAQPVDRGVF